MMKLATFFTLVLLLLSYFNEDTHTETVIASEVEFSYESFKNKDSSDKYHDEEFFIARSINNAGTLIIRIANAHNPSLIKLGHLRAPPYSNIS